MPQGTLSKIHPDKLDTVVNSLFTCNAETATTEMPPLPSELVLKLTTHQTDYLPELLGSGSVELQSQTIVSDFENTDGLIQNRASRGMIIKPSISHYIPFVGLQLTYECHAMEDSCHEQPMYPSIAQNFSIYLNGKHKKMHITQDEKLRKTKYKNVKFHN